MPKWSTLRAQSLDIPSVNSSLPVEEHDQNAPTAVPAATAAVKTTDQLNLQNSKKTIPEYQTACHFCPAEPRVTLPMSQGMPLPIQENWIANDDEYLCDGGDRADPVHYDKYNRFGLDTEDTIAEYRDHLGHEHMRPSNRVCIYAPRFGTVRTVSSADSHLNVDRLASNDETVGGSNLRSRTLLSNYSQPEMPGNLRIRSRASGVDLRTYMEGLSQTEQLSVHEKLYNLYQELRYLKSGMFEQADEATIAYGIQAAFIWSRDLNPVITASTVKGEEIKSQFNVQEIVGLEEKKGAARPLRIIKLADKKHAKAGDQVTFTIRYDNLGEKLISNVRIVDNLTPRLQYVEDSATSDRAGDITVTDNSEGSLVLTFVLDEPLKGGEGGTITFKTIVH